MSQWEWVAGVIAVESILEAGVREVEIIYTAHNRFDRRISRINRLARERGTLVEAVSADAMTTLTGSHGHGGVAAKVGARVVLSASDLVTRSNAVVVMLDGVEDPYNFGQAVRSLYAAGIDGLVVRPRNWLSAGAAIRASAGATEFMPTAEADSPEVAAELFRPLGLRVAVATAERAQPMNEVDLGGPLLLVIGGEKRGITRSFMRAADVRVAVPYGRPFPHALGIATAATALAFEVLRQRNARGS